MIVEIGICGAAGFLFLRGIYHSGVLAGWIAQGLRMSTTPKAPPPRPPEAPQFDEAAWTAKEAQREAAMFLAVPTAWWLDPNRWGDNPNWRDDRPREVLRAEPRDPKLAAVQNMPRCPNCHTGSQVAILAEHGGYVSLWDCATCGAEFTKNGETWKSQKSRNAREQHYPCLPCGCSGFDAHLEHHKVKNGATWTRCGRCEKWWEPPSNDPTSGKLAQGGHGHDKDDMQPTAQWYWGHHPTEHGICPSYLCQMPVVKRDGMYYCTSSDCNYAHRGWK